jgi:hypothetical protein
VGSFGEGEDVIEMAAPEAEDGEFNLADAGALAASLAQDEVLDAGCDGGEVPPEAGSVLLVDEDGGVAGGVDGEDSFEAGGGIEWGGREGGAGEWWEQHGGQVAGVEGGQETEGSKADAGPEIALGEVW